MRKTAVILAAALLISLAGCGEPSAAGSGNGGGEPGGAQPVSAGVTDLMAGVAPLETDPPVGAEDPGAAVVDFGLRLFQNTLAEGENILISPLSVLCALAMTANGAEGETLAQMEEVFGLSVDQLNAFFSAYLASLPTEDACRLSLANSIWFTQDERFTVEQRFLQTNAAYYGAAIYRAPFDASTLDAVNRWVADNTGGMIEHILDEIPEDAVMYLINALAFEAEWEEIYEEGQVREGLFHLLDAEGTAREVELMYSEESWYLEDEGATGFIKYYAGGEYAFVALLPDGDVSLSDYVLSLTGEGLHALLSNPQAATVRAAIPKFKTGYSMELAGVLAGMGMERAFHPDFAEFSKLGYSTAGNIFIGRVLHKTYLAVDERGTEAGAATVVALHDGAVPMPEDLKTVTLDRPFLYLLIDCESRVPLFMGAVADVAG